VSKYLAEEGMSFRDDVLTSRKKGLGPLEGWFLSAFFRRRWGFVSKECRYSVDGRVPGKQIGPAQPV